jgi:hypothetical protein
MDHQFPTAAQDPSQNRSFLGPAVLEARIGSTDVDNGQMKSAQVSSAHGDLEALHLQELGFFLLDERDDGFSTPVPDRREVQFERATPRPRGGGSVRLPRQKVIPIVPPVPGTTTDAICSGCVSLVRQTGISGTRARDRSTRSRMS